MILLSRLFRLAVALSLAAAAFGDGIDRYIRGQLEARHLPGVSLAVVRRGEVVKTRGYGFAHVEHRVPASTRTVYEIGSISKQFTAYGILLLRDEGRLSLDDPLSKYLEATPGAWAGITIRHVLTHTAGLPDFDTGEIGFSYRREYTPAEFIALLGAQPLGFSPGERWSYANGFPLLGLVIEKVTGSAYAAFMRQRIFGPLGLASARLRTNTEIVPDRAAGYVFRDGALCAGREPLRPAIIAANGGIMMNVADFAKWDLAIRSGQFVKPGTLVEARRPTRLANGRSISHGLTGFTDTFNGHRFDAYWGSTVAGYSAVIRRYDEDLTVIVLANLEDGASAVDELSKRVADAYLPGAAIQGMKPRPDPRPGETEALRPALAELAARLAAPGRDRLRAALASRFEWLGDEEVTERHFNLDPALARLRRFRAGRKYVTVRLDASGALLGAAVEDE